MKGGEKYMKQKALSIFLGGMVVTLGLCFAPAVHAEEEVLPDHDQLRSHITAEVNAEVESKLSTDTNQSSTQPNTQPQPATSQPNDTLFINTGDNASADNSSTQNSSTAVNNQNTAAIDQEVNASANTGGNSASRNISFGGNAGVIHTGNAAVYSGLEAAANSNETSVGGTCSAPTSGSNVVNTGNNLDYNAGSTSNCSTTITNGNGAAINQVVNADANTGNNVADGNISFGGNAGVITTGNANVGSLLVTKANENLVIVGGVSGNGGPGSGASIYFVNTGDNAAVNASTSHNSAIAVTNRNQAAIDQLANIEANTGGNDSSRNINLNGDAGVIHTGDAIVQTKVEANANHNTTAVSHGNGGAGSSSSTDVVNTGDNLDVDASDEVSTNTTVTNTNNAEVDQEVNIVANTGNNTADRNIAFGGDAGVITTGDAIIVTELETEVNSNQTLISTETAPASTQGSDTEIVNTGDNLDVDVSSQNNSTTTVNNTNTAEVNQSVTATGNTGNNTASGNIGQSSMTTGNVTITTEIITNANNNYTFIVDSNVNGLELFKQFVQAFLGMDWEDLIGSQSPAHNNSVAIVNTGDNATILAEQVQNREVVVNNTNNATVNQNVNVNANTGNNTCDANVGDCKITTGNATIWTQLVANLNNNFTFIGNVQLPTPETPEEPVTPETPEQPVQPEVVEKPEPEVLGESVERQPQAVLAATTLPMTGGANLTLFGLVLLGGGLLLRFKKAQA